MITLVFLFITMHYHFNSNIIQLSQITLYKHYQNFMKITINCSNDEENIWKSDANSDYRNFLSFFKTKRNCSLNHLSFEQVLLSYRALFALNQQEISKVIGDIRPPSFNDKCSLPYTQATILETLRLAGTAPLAFPHSVPCDVTFANYVIPKGAFILPYLDTALRDSKLFKNPDELRPERFLSEDGTRIENFQHLMPFGAGRTILIYISLLTGILIMQTSVLSVISKDHTHLFFSMIFKESFTPESEA